MAKGKTKIVNADGSQVEGERFRDIYKCITDAIHDKDEIVYDIREHYDTAKRKGLRKLCLKDAIKWAPAGIEAFIDHCATVLQYMAVAKNVAPQLDLFHQAIGRPIFQPEEQSAVERLEEQLEEEPSSMRPIGEVAQSVVATVGEMVRQNDAEAAASGEATPEMQAEAKLQGEVAGRDGQPASANPHPITSSLYTWWAKGWSPAHEEWKQKADAGATVTPIGKSKRGEGFKDKTPRMTAAQAAKLLGGDDAA